ncbi:unnamed protein product [Rotaria sp. Silwood2]|nr:unnamed protein product [Rotaria sp. Silwood2]CAF3497017.1 unnamed protein product [Rotaria sp. Silwood2]CAF4386557.1 unnamed protein product [Rotaria sp. Silwood2]
MNLIEHLISTIKKRNSTIELRESCRLIWIIERSIIVERISNFIECANMADDRSLNYEQKYFLIKTFTSESIISSNQEQSSISNVEKINLDTQIDDIRSNSKNSSSLPEAIVETLQPLISSTIDTNKTNPG